MAWTVAVTDYEYPDLEVERRVLQAGLGEVELLGLACRTPEEVVAAARDADGLLQQYCRLDAEALARLPRCRVVSRYGVGLDAVDLEAATRLGIVVTHVPDYCVDEVSDHALALLLACARGVVRLDRAVRAGRWAYRGAGPLERLRGRTLGLVGFGRIPRALTPKALALGLRVLAFDPLVAPELVRAAGAEPAARLEEVAERSDFVSLHAPLTAATRGLVGEAFLRRMRPHAVLINTARGGLVDEAALVRALREGWIAAAALDVLASEPPAPDHPLLALPQVVLTPHAAWYSETSEVELRTKAAANVVAVLRGERPPYLANPEVWDRRRR